MKATTGRNVRSNALMSLMPEVVAALKNPGRNDSLVRDVEKALAASVEPVKVPSDADIEALAEEHSRDCHPHTVYGELDRVGFARALLARYGQPAASAEPVGRAVLPDPKPVR